MSNAPNCDHQKLICPFASWAAARIQELEVPLCIGRPIIGLLAKEGGWTSSNGRSVVAADELFGSDPYERIAELEATAKAPLPGEVAGLIEGLRAYAKTSLAAAPSMIEQCMEWKAATALERMAREIERLSDDNESFRDDVAKLEVDNERQCARIAELEALAKCDSCGKPFDENGGICEPCHSSAIGSHIKPLGTRIRELEAAHANVIDAHKITMADLIKVESERDAIEAATIERCAQVADEVEREADRDFALDASYAAEDIAKRIRTLKESP